MKINYATLFDFEDELTREEILEHIFKVVENLDNKKLRYVYKMVSEI